MMAQNHGKPATAAIEAARRALEEELGPRLQEVRTLLYDVVTAQAKEEGWSDSQAEWLDELAQVPFYEAVLNGVPAREALERSMAVARRSLAEAYFDKALADGRGRIGAFLTVVNLERQIATRRGEPDVDYPDAWLLAAVEAVETAAAAGADVQGQMAAGFAALREAATKSPRAS